MNTNIQSSLVASGNTYNPSLIVLRDKGYDLRVEKGNDDQTLWFATKDGHDFLAYTGPELLGLVTLWEHLGEGWNRQKPDIFSELIDKLDG